MYSIRLDTLLFFVIAVPPLIHIPRRGLNLASRRSIVNGKRRSFSICFRTGDIPAIQPSSTEMRKSKERQVFAGLALMWGPFHVQLVSQAACAGSCAESLPAVRGMSTTLAMASFVRFCHWNLSIRLGMPSYRRMIAFTGPRSVRNRYLL